jgi:hypothetical protein
MNAKDLVIAIKTRFAGKGTADAQKQLDATARKAQEVEKKTVAASGAFGKLSNATTSFKGALEKVNSAMAGFGALALLNQVASLVKAIVEARRKQEELVKSIAFDNAAAGLAGLTAAYTALKDGIAAANSETQDLRASTELLLEAERRLQDAKLSSREEEELATLDPGDSLYAEKEAEIRARYGRTRAGLSSGRNEEDVARQREALQQDIQRLKAQAAQRDQVIAEFQSDARLYSGRAAKARDASVAAQNRANWFTGRKGETWLGKQAPEIDQYAGYSANWSAKAAEALSGMAGAMKDRSADDAAIQRAEAKLRALDTTAKAVRLESSVKSSVSARAERSADRSLFRAESERDTEAEIALAQKAGRDMLPGRFAEARAELDAARSGYYGAVGASRAPTAPASLRGAWDSSGRIVTADAVDRAAAESSEAARRAVDAAAARLREAAENFKRLEAEMKNAREAD